MRRFFEVREVAKDGVGLARVEAERKPFRLDVGSKRGAFGRRVGEGGVPTVEERFERGGKFRVGGDLRRSRKVEKARQNGVVGRGRLLRRQLLRRFLNLNGERRFGVGIRRRRGGRFREEARRGVNKNGGLSLLGVGRFDVNGCESGVCERGGERERFREDGIVGRNRVDVKRRVVDVSVGERETGRLVGERAAILRRREKR